MHVHVIGAGIAGPVAALALKRAGHDVTVFERRSPGELDSYSVIGISEENCQLMLPLGIDIRPITMDNMYHEWTTSGMEIHRMSSFKFVVWEDAHNLVVNAAEKAGVRFNWETEGVPGDRTVQATGVGFASRRGLKPSYAYMVYRGLSEKTTNYPWLSWNDPQKRFSFKLAHTNRGASWELYVHRDNAPLHSQVANVLPDECGLLEREFEDITHATYKLATHAISDWEVPVSMRHDGAVTIGDANGAVRPHTGAGANLGIYEALETPELLFNIKVETPLLHARHVQHHRGIVMGQEVMGK